MSIFKNSVILITGGTGSWGNELTTQLLEKDPKKIIIYSRSELHQVNMQRAFNNPKIKFVIGDVRDYEQMLAASRGVDYIFHLAALKHVPICEDQPEEAIKTNITGTMNVITAAKENNVKKVIDVSTDKAVDPFNFYGMTKAIGERLVINANLGSKTKFVCIRGGNVLGTNGSVVPFFIDQIRRQKTVFITDKEMTRYYITQKQAINLLFKATEVSAGGETFVMKMPSCKVIDLAEVLIGKFSNGEKILIKETGVRPGEKIHECLISRHEAPSTYQYDKNYYVILPQIKIEGLEKKYKKFKKVLFEEYSSNSVLMSKPEIKVMLKNGNLI